ncbi:MAG: glycosyltransferase family 2 protein [Saprospiraceae bacterium]
MTRPSYPFLSIITACYNDCENLKKTIESIEAQQVDFVELIIVDGASTDDTLHLIEAKKQIITKWLSEKDKGVYNAMNKGIEMASGEYILFLNAGDTFYNSSILRTIKMRHKNEDILYGNAVFVNKDGSFKSPRHKSLPSELNWKSFKNGMVVCHQALLVKRIIAPHYLLQYKITSDLDWAIRALKKAQSVKNLNLTISNFQFGGMSDSQKKEALLERWQILVSQFGLLNTLLAHLKIPFTYTAWKIQSLYKRN